MPNSVLTRRRSIVARIAVLAMVASLMVIGAAPASAQIDTSATCPDEIPSAGFTDIGSLDAAWQDAINCIAFYEITQGTNAAGTLFSPGETVPRRQMALFLTRTAVELGVELPTATSQGFTDIGHLPQFWQDAINQIAILDITKGTNAAGTLFSPDQNVNRRQMALFIYRLGVVAELGLDTAVDGTTFADVGSLSSEAQIAIDALADAEVALGTGGNMFSPEQDLLRRQMALFLTRTLALGGVTPEGLVEGAIDAPELVDVTESSFDDTDEELVLVYTFDEELDEVADDGLFFVYEADGTQIVADSATLDGDEVTVTFTVDEDTYELLTVATVGFEAVADLDAVPNPEGSAPLFDATIGAATPGLTATANLDDVTWESRDVGGGTSEFVFHYDEDVTVVAATPGFWILLTGGEGTDWFNCSTIDDGDLTDDEVTVECPAAITSSEWARGYDNSVVTAVDQVADERATATPDLVSVSFLSSNRVDFLFDEAIELPGGVTDSDNAGYTGSLADYDIYDADGDTVSPDRVVVLGDARTVRAEFLQADLNAGNWGAAVDTEVDEAGVGGIVYQGAVTERFGDERDNQDDEARIGSGTDVDVDAGSTLGPDLVSVGAPEESGTDIFGDPNEWEIVVTFDEDVDACTVGDYHMYTEDGDVVEADACDVDDDEVTLTFTDDDVLDAVLGGVASGAATADGTDNPEGSALVGG